MGKVRENVLGRPGATGTTRHVGEVEDEETVIVALFAGDADALTSVVGDVVVVNAHVDGAVGGGDQATVLGGGTVDILDVAVGWVRQRPEVEVVEE